MSQCHQMLARRAADASGVVFTSIRVDNDNEPNDLLRTVNEALAGQHLMFVNDGQDHDGFAIYHLKPTGAR